MLIRYLEKLGRSVINGLELSGRLCCLSVRRYISFAIGRGLSMCLFRCLIWALIPSPIVALTMLFTGMVITLQDGP